MFCVIRRQLSLGHASLTTTERFLGVRQDLGDAPCHCLKLGLSAEWIRRRISFRFPPDRQNRQIGGSSNVSFVGWPISH
jgi:hypothetical protein